MEFITRLLILLLLVAAAAAVIACLVSYDRKRRQRTEPAVAEGAQPTAVEETQAMVIEEAQPAAAEEPQPIVTEEAEPIAAEETQLTPVEGTQAEAAPEAQPMVVQEAEPMAVTETKPAAVEELQPTVAEQTRPTVVEEAQPTEPEETKPPVAEEAQPQVVEEVSGKAEGRRPKPIARGGRSRDPAQGHREGPTTRNRATPKPEVVCWKRERQWIPAVEVPEELLEDPSLVVLQDELPLTPDESKEGCWRLGKTSGEVIVRLSEAEGAREVRIPLGKEGYLLFKLSGRDLSQGRKVKSPSSGQYLVIAPDDWERDESLSGPPPVTPEAVSLNGYQAHFFELEKGSDSKIAFRTPEGQSVVIESKASRFELVGNRLNDASDTMGPLFGERPPRVRALDDQAWQGVSTIVIGEEGSERGRWRTQMTPVPGELEQDLPSELAARKGGWYFLRLYDTNDDLIESLDFRFLSALKEIRIPQPSPVPTREGHNWVRVEFLHEPGCVVQPVSSLPDIQIERQDDKTILSIPPDPAYDETRWLIGPEGEPRVEVAILVERVWWGTGEEHNSPSTWKDEPFTLTRDHFAATSKKALWLKLPKERWVDKVFVGFEKAEARSYDVKVTEKTIAVPYREFGDSKEVRDRTQKHPLKVWIKRDDWATQGIIEGVVAIIPGEHPNGKVSVEKERPLNLDMIPAPRLATSLTRLLRKTAGPLRMLIKEVRSEYFKGRPARQADSVGFKRRALCVIALSLELDPQIRALKRRWVVRAELARDEFPQIMEHLRNRYKEISASHAYRARSIPDRRQIA